MICQGREKNDPTGSEVEVNNRLSGELYDGDGKQKKTKSCGLCNKPVIKMMFEMFGNIP